MTEDLIERYAQLRRDYLEPAAGNLENLLKDYLKDRPRVDRIAARAKSVDSFIEKSAKQIDGKYIYDDPLHQIQDQIGARIITFYKSDVEDTCELVRSYFRSIEEQSIVPETDSEFGYFGRHFVLLCPSDIFNNTTQKEHCPNFFELQVKTLYQHAWSEANHDMGYKTHTPLTSDERRKIAFTAAQSWGADTIFNELFAAKRTN